MKKTKTKPASRSAAAPSTSVRWPAEWEPHEATWIAFPHHRTDFPGKLSVIPSVFAEMARVLTQAERVRLLVRDASEKTRAEALFRDVGVDLSQVDFVRRDTNRSWLRDSMPLWVVAGRGARRRRIAVNFTFDGWSRYRDHQLDAAAGDYVAARYADAAVTPLQPSGRRAVLEGGSIDGDGQGTLLTTEECLLTGARARNPELDRDATEAMLLEQLGIQKVIWLENGIAGDDTSGHIDDFARFVAPGRVVVCDEPNRRDDNHAPLRRAQKALESTRDARGRKLDVIRLPMPEPVVYRGERLPASYANFYIGNAAVLVPTFSDPRDYEALGILGECFPDRPVVGIHARDLVIGLGTLHCSTMQQTA